MALNLTRDNGQKITNSINLVKAKRGQSLNLKKIAPTMSKVLIMLTWEGDADLDSSIVLLQSNGKPVDGIVKSEPVDGDTPRALVYYNNLDMTKGIKHGGDLRAGGQEEIDIDLSMIDSDVSEIIHVASAYSEGSKVTFGEVKSATITIIDADKNEAVLTYDLVENADMATSVEIAKLFLKDGEWRFGSMENIVGSSDNGLSDIGDKYFP